MVAVVVLARYERLPIALRVTCTLRVVAQACGVGLETRSFGPLAAPIRKLSFSVLGLYFDLHRRGFETQHPLVHTPLHVLGGTDEAHEVDRLGTAPQPECQAVFAKLRNQVTRHSVLGLLLS